MCLEYLKQKGMFKLGETMNVWALLIFSADRVPASWTHQRVPERSRDNPTEQSWEDRGAPWQGLLSECPQQAQEPRTAQRRHEQ